MSYDVPPSIVDRITELERRLERVELSRRLPSSSVGTGGIEVLDGGSILLRDATGTVRVRIASGGITVFDADGLERWTDETAWGGHTEPDSVLPASTFVSGSSWQSVDEWTWRDYAGYAQVSAMISPPPPGDEGALRLRTVDPFGGEVVNTLGGLEMGASGRDYPVTIGGTLPLPFGISYHKLELQARIAVGAGSMAVTPLAASWSA